MSLGEQREFELRLWKIIRPLETFTINDIYTEAAMTQRRIYSLLGLMVASQILSVDRTSKPHIFSHLTEKPIHCPPVSRLIPGRRPTIPERIWMAIKVQDTFTLKELTLSVQCSESMALNYLRILVRAGYVKVINKAYPLEKRLYSFLRHKNTGVKAPYIHCGDIVDGNQRRVVWKKEVVNEAS